MIICRKAVAGDALLYFEWANDDEVRRQSYNEDKIDWREHEKWFLSKITDSDCLMLLFFNESHEPVGQVRFQKEDEKGFVIGISIAERFRGKGHGADILVLASETFFKEYHSQIIYAYIKSSNTGSVRAFERAGFIYSKNLVINNNDSVQYIKTNK